MSTRFEIVKIEWPAEKGYRVLETNLTCDGYRTRVVDGYFLSFEDALDKTNSLNGLNRP